MSIFDQLKAQVYEFELVSPDGQTLVVQMRALSRAEVAQIDYNLPSIPQPPVTEIKKDEEGNFKPVYNFQDGGYMQAIADRGALRIKRLILKSWTDSIPGDTEEEKLSALDELSSWAMNGLTQAVSKLLVISAEEVRLRRFQPA